MVRPAANDARSFARRVPSTSTITVRPHDGTSTMLQLAKVLPKLNTTDRATALTLLGNNAVAPCTGSDGRPDTAPYQTASDPDGHFEIHYTTTGPNQVTDQYLAAVQATLDDVYTTEITSLGYQAPLIPAPSATGWWSGGTQIPIALCNIAPDLYGYCAPVGSSVTWSFPAACTLRNSYADNTVNNLTYAYYNPKLDGADTDAPLKVTAAHEFFHAVQFRQDAQQPLWLMEGTAVWMENEVYPAIHDYLQYLPYSGIKQPLVPFNADSTYTPYGDFLLFKFLARTLGGRDVVKHIWSYLGQHQTATFNPSAMTALTAVASARGQSLASLMLTYSVWNTLPAGSYLEPYRYGSPIWWLHPTLDRRVRALTGRRTAIRPLAAATVDISRGARVLRTTRLQIGVNGAGGWFTLRRAMSNGSSVVSHYRIGARGTVVTVPFNSSVSYVVVTLNNVAPSGAAKTFAVRANVL